MCVHFITLMSGERAVQHTHTDTPIDLHYVFRLECIQRTVLAFTQNTRTSTPPLAFAGTSKMTPSERQRKIERHGRMMFLNTLDCPLHFNSLFHIAEQ